VTYEDDGGIYNPIFVTNTPWAIYRYQVSWVDLPWGLHSRAAYTTHRTKVGCLGAGEKKVHISAHSVVGTSRTNSKFWYFLVQPQ